jgi:hypothetical protein
MYYLNGPLDTNFQTAILSVLSFLV